MPLYLKEKKLMTKIEDDFAQNEEKHNLNKKKLKIKRGAVGG